ncbi:MAG: hypothetical protein ACI9G1_003818 [Pirellulaceae bacterium]|jgi:hypothetical protein
MKIAIVYNRESQRVINLLGMPNREKYGLKSIKRISDAFKQAGHQVAAFEGLGQFVKTHTNQRRMRRSNQFSSTHTAARRVVAKRW